MEQPWPDGFLDAFPPSLADLFQGDLQAPIPNAAFADSSDLPMMGGQPAQQGQPNVDGTDGTQGSPSLLAGEAEGLRFSLPYDVDDVDQLFMPSDQHLQQSLSDGSSVSSGRPFSSCEAPSPVTPTTPLIPPMTSPQQPTAQVQELAYMQPQQDRELAYTQPPQDQAPGFFMPQQDRELAYTQPPQDQAPGFFMPQQDRELAYTPTFTPQDQVYDDMSSTPSTPTSSTAWLSSPLSPASTTSSSSSEASPQAPFPPTVADLELAVLMAAPEGQVDLVAKLQAPPHNIRFSSEFLEIIPCLAWLSGEVLLVRAQQKNKDGHVSRKKRPADVEAGVNLRAVARFILHEITGFPSNADGSLVHSLAHLQSIFSELPPQYQLPAQPEVSRTPPVLDGPVEHVASLLAALASTEFVRRLQLLCDQLGCADKDNILRIMRFVAANRSPTQREKGTLQYILKQCNSKNEIQNIINYISGAQYNAIKRMVPKGVKRDPKYSQAVRRTRLAFGSPVDDTDVPSTKRAKQD
ncbi:hypothetical protein PTSG_11581 [Salpingoeca rosetta]|uniref:Uncharacterized protein n=1 Tax=Salpingoeca rosetta (strain ATCC 50818 / BSB-021) TaxID=946362 RepID=F2TWB3_SALR5|nr:uncharacterized protein PTSG_11581 [Salpingoeca rosetta]EGD72359.1 hypothetical protein PTSG_11581 [Salpingoeca rosetta]|eukprot:XP_004998928.1 hypothetical protein PTSG_11581 [Salpingoeca rosetta]